MGLSSRLKDTEDTMNELYEDLFGLSVKETRDYYESLQRKKDAWEQFFTEGRPEIEHPEVISGEILDSWKRCRDMGLDPRHVRKEIISREELENLRREKAELIEVIKPVFDTFSETLGNGIVTLDLYGPDLSFIYTFGNRSENDNRRYAVPGLRRAENYSGVTAMSLARETGRCVQVCGPEHFDITLHDKICTSVPLKDTKGNLTGIINMVEFVNKANPERTLQMMQGVSQSIHYGLHLLEKNRQLAATITFNETILENAEEGIFAADDSGVFCVMNKKARKYLNLPTDRDLDFKKISAYLKSNSLARSIMSGERVLNNQEFTLPIGGQNIRLYGSVRIFRDKVRNVQGIIATFTDLSSAQRTLKNVGGWEAKLSFEDIIGDSPELQHVIEIARETANLPSNILIEGESGTGKELFAHSIHNYSKRSKGPFIAVNCSAIPRSLMESELFGYEGGSFTGAKKTGQPGRFELANNGTIFLDEVNSIPLDMQAKLLRVLQDKTVTRIGSSSAIHLDIKVIAASNVDLKKEVEQNRFRLDLYYRLNVITLRIPPLRERLVDLPVLCGYFLNMLTNVQERPIVIEKEAMDLLYGYSWPGNVRELENIMERVVVLLRLEKQDRISERMLRQFPEFPGSSETEKGNEGTAIVELPAEQEADPAGRKEAFPEMPVKTKEEYFRSRVLQALEHNRWNYTETANELNIGRTTLYRWLKKWGVK